MLLWLRFFVFELARKSFTMIFTSTPRSCRIFKCNFCGYLTAFTVSGFAFLFFVFFLAGNLQFELGVMRIGRLRAIHVGQLIETRTPGSEVVVFLLLIIGACKQKKYAEEIVLVSESQYCEVGNKFLIFGVFRYVLGIF